MCGVLRQVFGDRWSLSREEVGRRGSTSAPRRLSATSTTPAIAAQNAIETEYDSDGVLLTLACFGEDLTFRSGLFC
jgi:hypothetical protein